MTSNYKYHNLVVDLVNIAFVRRFAKLGMPKSERQKDPVAKYYLLAEIIKTIVYESVNHSATGLVITTDGRGGWRKDVYNDYKATRTTDEDFYYKETLEAANMAFDFFRGYTHAYCLAVDKAEADDIIAVWCQESDERFVQNTVLSTDTDFVQLIDERTRVYSPTQKEFRETEDVMFDLFLKCIRGDRNDNIPSAFPRVRTTRLEKAWEDDLELLNILETVLPDNTPIKANAGKKVGELLEFNMNLIDLTRQPSYIRDNILDAIMNYEISDSPYSQIQAKKFLVDNDMEVYLNIFDYRDKALMKPPVFRKKLAE